MPQFLVELKEGMYHLLPDAYTSQEQNMGDIKPVGKLRGVNIAQQDGSRLKVIKSKKLPWYEIAARLYELYPDKGEIWTGLNYSQEHLDRLLQKRDKLEYRGYWMHTFLNAIRVYPILIDRDMKTFMDLSKHFKEFQPEDDIGVLIKSPDDTEKLVVSGLSIQLLQYQSYVRLCHCCGVVSNTSKPKKTPWAAYKSRLSQ